MKVWRWILLLVVVATLVAFGWHWIAIDPGYVFVRMRGWQVETSVLFAVVLLVLAWALLTLLWRLLRWPFGALTQRHRRLSRQRLADGLVALAEGRHGDAERDLNRAARLDALRGPALLAAAEAAWRRGESPRAQEALDQAAQAVPRAARVLRARVLRRDGKPAEAMALLAPQADSGELSPAGWRELALAALAVGDLRRARSALDPLHKSAALGPRAYAALEAKVLTASLLGAPDGAALNTLWSQLPKTQRRASAVVDAYARRAAAFGMLLPALDELESALRREWSPSLVETYGSLPGEDLDARLRRAVGWLDAHPNDVALQLTLGRLCARLRQYARAHDYLQRALALAPTPSGWEALGELYALESEPTLAQRCYRNALALGRGEPVEDLPQPQHPDRLDTRPIALEERSEHGVPRLRE